MDRYVDVVSELACLNDPESYAGGSFMLLVGPPKPDRSKDRGQTRHGPPHLPTCDLNAKVGDENIGAERTMGIHGCGSIINKGERLVELCASNDLVIGGTLFEHPAIHKITWYSPNGRDKNQIYHIAINNIWKRPLLDVRVKRGADVGSDHLLVIASIRLKLRRTDRSDMHKKRLDVNKLKDLYVRKLFTIQLKNRFQALSEQEKNSPQEMENINHLWNQVRTS
ncbi:craniofacial development protein 2-like [Elysia marginata]|uniref:Craniofacial development protein 2-like n=1 Tax=Elysia marginata TaxID=1093978 RepID=A0AAV4GJ61_9GAST|nr:craniofacial development protein 2-like [Elysia marginata]